MNEQQQPEYQQSPQYQQPVYGDPLDMAERYGAIIKELTDTSEQIKQLELHIRGLKINDKNEKIKIHEPLIKDEETISKYISSVKSVANIHTDLSYFDDNTIVHYLKGWYTEQILWMMRQGKKIPTGTRGPLLMDGCYIINASLHKARGGKLMIWSKGQVFSSDTNNNQQQKKSSIWDSIIPNFGRK